jgi:hypothetical protein
VNIYEANIFCQLNAVSPTVAIPDAGFDRNQSADSKAVEVPTVSKSSASHRNGDVIGIDPALPNEMLAPGRVKHCSATSTDDEISTSQSVHVLFNARCCFAKELRMNGFPRKSFSTANGANEDGVCASRPGDPREITRPQAVFLSCIGQQKHSTDL